MFGRGAGLCWPAPHSRVRCVIMSGGADSYGGGLVPLGPVPWPGAAGGRVQVAGSGDAPAAGGLDVAGPRDAQPAAGAAPGVELSGFDPVVDDAGGAAQPPGGFGDGDLAAGVGGGGGDVVGVADPLDGLDVEGAAVAGGQPVGVEPADQLVVAGGRSELPGELDRSGRGAPGRAGVDGPAGDKFVGGAGVPADPDAHLAGLLLGEQGDVGDQGAQQPFAVLVAGGG